MILGDHQDIQFGLTLTLLGSLKLWGLNRGIRGSCEPSAHR